MKHLKLTVKHIFFTHVYYLHLRWLVLSFGCDHPHRNECKKVPFTLFFAVEFKCFLCVLTELHKGWNSCGGSFFSSTI